MAAITTTFNGKTITAEELAKSRSGDTLGSETRRWVVEGSDDADDITGALDLIIPRSLPSGFLYNKISYDYPEVERGDDSIWLCSVEYVTAGGTRSGSVDVPVGTARLRRSTALEDVQVVEPVYTQWIKNVDNLWEQTTTWGVQRRLVPLGKTAVKYEGIGDNGDTFDGASVPRQVVTFSYDFTVPKLMATTTFWGLCDRCVGALNSQKFKGYRSQTVLCTGIEGVYSTNQDTTLTFNFKYKGWRKAWTFDAGDGNTITLPEYSSWAYLDFHTKTVVEENPRKIKVEVQQIDVIRLFPFADFNELGIPGPDIGGWEDEQV